MNQIELSNVMNKRVNTWCRTRTIILSLVVGVAFVAVLVDRLGHWLMVADQLENAQAIVVLSGHLPFRAMEAASIYRQGWAPEVWLTRAIRPAQEEALAQLGIEFVRGEAYNREVLERLGVSAMAIRVLKKGVRNTAEEVQAISEELKRVGGNGVIIVTSKPHTRRVRAIWRALRGDTPELIVRYAREDPFNPARWWRNTKDALAVSHEVFGIINVWTGFPVQPDRQG